MVNHRSWGHDSVDVRNDWNIGPKQAKGLIVIGMRTMFLLYSLPMTSSPCAGGVVAVAGLVVRPSLRRSCI